MEIKDDTVLPNGWSVGETLETLLCREIQAEINRDIIEYMKNPSRGMLSTKIDTQHIEEKELAAWKKRWEEAVNRKIDEN